MPGWTIVDSDSTQGRTFRRPLDATECEFFWYDLLNGSTSSIQHYALRLSNGPRDTHIFSEANILRAWLSTKRRYPLAGAVVQGANGPLCLRDGSNSNENDGDDGGTDGPELHFVIQEHGLAVLRPGEVVFGQVNCVEELEEQKAAILDGQRPLSEERLVRLYVFRETKRTEALHLVTMMAHCVMDGTAIITFMRCLLDTLSRTDSEPIQIPLEDRLAMAIPSTDLQPVHIRMLSPARRRWRKAVGIVIFQLRIAKRQGGHTLPRFQTRSSLRVTARSGHVSISFTRAQSAAALSNCRLQKITFGNAFLPLAQVAMTRVLFRRYLRGEISEEEWEYRKRQPYLSGSLLNLRPYLDKEWFERGGGGEFMLSITFPFYRLPFMTLGSMELQNPHHHGGHGHTSILSDEAPPFSELLTFDRFLHRAGLVKKQTAAFVSHPLFFEIVRAASLLFVERVRLNALRWINRNNDEGSSDDSDDVLATTDMPMVLAHGGSSFGDADLVFPSEYPIPPTDSLSPYSPVPHPAKAGYATLPSAPSYSEADAAPKIVIEYSGAGLNPREGELYLGAVKTRGQLRIYVFYDANAYEQVVVREWLDEVRDAVLWYLGHSRTAQQTSCSAELARAKL